MDWERIATSAVILEISKTPNLGGFINEGDKEPCWDGYIYIYKDNKHTKKEIKRIPTQVKGKGVDDKKVEQVIKYPISYDDLYAYMMDGGILFFVVYIDKNTGTPLQIYYSTLLPINIKEIIKEKRNTYSVSFYKFPEDNNKKTEIVLDAYTNTQKQKSFAGAKLPSIEELRDKGVLESISFPFANLGKDVSPMTLPHIMEGRSITFYANILGNPIGIPVKYHENISHVTTFEDIDENITVKGVVYYDNYRILYSITETKILIGNCLCFTILESEEEEKKYYTPSFIIEGSLKQQIKSLKFILTVVEFGGVNIGETYFSVPFSDNKVIDKMKIRLKQQEYIQKLLDRLHVKADLRIDKCDEEDNKTISLLIGAFGEGRPVKDLPDNVVDEVQTLKMSNITLGMVYVKHQDERYYLHDFFDEHLKAYETIAGETIPVSRFAILNAEDFMKYDNLYLPNIIKDFKRLPASSGTLSQGNLLLSEMLKAYDCCINNDLLVSANQMNEWLLEYPGMIDKEICMINRYQIIFRQRELCFDEKIKLHSIVENTSDINIKVGAWILLGEMDKVDEIFATFTAEQEGEFHTLPIYTLYCRSRDKS